MFYLAFGLLGLPVILNTMLIFFFILNFIVSWILGRENVRVPWASRTAKLQVKSFSFFTAHTLVYLLIASCMELVRHGMWHDGDSH